MTPQEGPNRSAPAPVRPLEKRDANLSPARGTRGAGYDELAGAPPAVWDGTGPAEAPVAPAAPANVGKPAAARKPGVPAKAAPAVAKGEVGAKKAPEIPKPPVPTVFPPEAMRAECEALLARYPQRLAALIPILHLAQRRLGGWISPELEAGIANYLGCSD